ncbi:EmrB/QacA subfamily drug resistance transporter [Nocardia transvalensis]|uniref:EmrB/QacA subfamily drug resistance transporter n=1 Tax=Nocardia transvalensis TaxID=37333 RepID=A0A7W9PAW5_9NOCA|nr:MDR family MFS transporter [Nocardia transvalensis]MBB5912636.1 EmrB/QacA subfamily drug resistance transporter [Nocardia transvalensis]
MRAATGKSSIGLRSDRGAILAALMLATSLVALDSTIIATAVLTITDSLGGFSQFPWLFSIYLLAQAVTVPIYGKIADTFGRKPVMLFGIAAFALGSLLCGIATTMPALIVFRAVQGIGAGAVQPMSMTIAGDIYTLEERATVQGYLAGVWAASSVLGPLLGGIFSEYVSWRWIFLINLPLAALAAWVLIRSFRETAPRQRQSIDYLGAVLLAGGAGAIILGLLEGGHSWAWTSPVGIGVFAGGVALLVVFAFVERGARSPILPLWVFTRRIVVTASLASLLIGAVMLGLTSYVPTFAQGVLGVGALVAGLTVGALTLGWPLTASQAGKLYLRIGFRRTALLGSSLAALGALSTLLIGSGSTLWQVAASCFVIGAGMGWVAAPTLIAAQTSAEWSERGVVTATTMFARSIGSAVGVAVFGALVNLRVGGVEHPAPEALSSAIQLVFIGVSVMAVVMVVAAAALPRDRAARSVPAPEPSATVPQE